MLTLYCPGVVTRPGLDHERVSFVLLCAVFFAGSSSKLEMMFTLL